VARVSLQSDVSWTLIGNVAFGVSQFAVLVAFAKLATVEALGQFALATAICSPIITFLNLQLRGLQATDATESYTLAEYLSLRVATSFASIVVVLAIAVWTGYPRSIALTILLMAAGKAVDAISDVLYGKMQQVCRFDTIAKSQLLKAALSLALVVGCLRIWQSALAAVAGILAACLLSRVLFDLRRPRGLSRLSSRPLTLRLVSQGLARLSALVVLALPIGLVMLLSSLQLNIPRYYVEHLMGTR